MVNSKDQVFAYVIERLNKEAISTARYVVDETIQLDELGAAVTRRHISQVKIKIPVKKFDEELSKLLSSLSATISGFSFRFVHQIVTMTLKKYRAFDSKGKNLHVTESKQFGGTAIIIDVPINLTRTAKHVEFLLPEYTLELEHSRLAIPLGDLWLLQWTHGAPGETKYTLTIKLPLLRKGLRRVFTSEFARSYPPSTSVKGRVLQWFSVIPAQNTYGVQMVYGKRSRKHLFSPLGFLGATLATIILTLLFQPQIEKFLSWIMELLGGGS